MTTEPAGWLVADSVWWDGRLRGPGAVKLISGGGPDHGGAAGGPVPVSAVPVGARRRKLPGTLLPGLGDAHVHSALADLATVRAGGIAWVWDLGGVPDRVARLRDAAAGPFRDAAGPFRDAAGPFRDAAAGPFRDAAAGPARDATAWPALPRMRIAGPF
ncbi:MAG TPA: hypothetical protein VFH03_12895, partial [Actinoplanes sp.]|nr:hypothetical protein [Actinoplanes sp.]